MKRCHILTPSQILALASFAFAFGNHWRRGKSTYEHRLIKRNGSKNVVPRCSTRRFLTFGIHETISASWEEVLLPQKGVSGFIRLLSLAIFAYCCQPNIQWDKVG